MRVFSGFVKGLVFISIFAACSSPDSDAPPRQGNNTNTQTINEANVRIFARSSWQDVGFEVRAGDKIKIIPSGEWTGGQLSVGVTEAQTRAIYCDANGCNGDLVKNYWTHGPGNPNLTPEQRTYQFSEVAAGGGTGGNNTSKLLLHDFYEQNVARGQGQSYAVQKAGFGGVDATTGQPLLDGKTICFSNTNIFLGASGVMAKDLKTGHWYQRSRDWAYLRDQFLRGADFQRGSAARVEAVNAIATNLTRIVTLYENATCTQPPHTATTESLTMAQIAGNLDDNWFPFVEHVYDPVYFVTVPTGNYGTLCRTDRDVHTAYAYGIPSSYVPKNDCAAATKNVLIMKIVGSTDKFEDQVPIVVGRQYETTEFTVPKSGWIFLKNNDADTGIFDNGNMDNSFIDVKIKRTVAAASTN